MIMGKIYIADTLRSLDSDAYRESLVKKVAAKLHTLSCSWKDGSFKYNNWVNEFPIEYYHWVPQQTNGYDCGLYVCLFMLYPHRCIKNLTEDQSVKARELVAVKLYKCKKNLIPSRHPDYESFMQLRIWKIDFLLYRGNCQFSILGIQIDGLTLDKLRKEIISELIGMFEIEQLYFDGIIPLSGGTMHIATNEDLQLIICMYIDMGKNMVELKIKDPAE